MARSCTDLRKVNVQGCRNVQDDGVIRLAESCPELSYLCLSNCSHLTDASLLSLAANCAKLTTLECASVSQFTDTGFGALARNCHLLERLDLEGNTSVGFFWMSIENIHRTLKNSYKLTKTGNPHFAKCQLFFLKDI